MSLQRTLLLRFACLTVFVFSSALTSADDSPPADAEAVIGRAIDQLSSPRFGSRRQAFNRLVSQGSQAIAAVEASAAERDLDHAERCVEILAEIATETDSREAALAALDRLASDDSFAGSVLAEASAFQLRETSEERAVRLLTSAGVRLRKSTNDSGIRSVSGIYRDKLCAHLQHLPSLKSVSLTGTGVTDRCFPHLVKATQLESVSMLRCSVSNAGLAEIPKLRNLTRVSLGADSISAPGLRHLGELNHLRSVAVFSSVGAAELRVLSELSVRSLYLSDLQMLDGTSDVLARLDSRISSLYVTIKGVTNDDLHWVKQTGVSSIGLAIEDSPQVTDEGLLLLQVKGLRSLRLNNTGISDAGLANIAAIENLTSLSLYDSPITAQGLQHLVKMDQLRSLTLSRTKVSDESVALLKKSMPNLRYVHNNLGVPQPPPKPVPAATPAINPAQ